MVVIRLLVAFHVFVAGTVALNWSINIEVIMLTLVSFKVIMRFGICLLFVISLIFCGRLNL